MSTPVISSTAKTAQAEEPSLPTDLSQLSEASKGEKKVDNGMHASDSDSHSQSDSSSCSSSLSDDTLGDNLTSDEEKHKKKGHDKDGADKKPEVQIDGFKKKLIANSIMQHVQCKSTNPNPGSPTKSSHKLHTKGHHSKNADNYSFKTPNDSDMQKQEELRRRLEEELKQQQQQLRMLKKAQAQRDKEAAAKELMNHASVEGVAGPSKASLGHSYCSNTSGNDSEDDLDSQSESELESLNNSERAMSDADGDQSNSVDSIQMSSQGDGHTAKHSLSESNEDRTPNGSPSKRRRVVLDEKELRIPMEHGWQRQTTIHTMGRRGIVGDVFYFAPCGKKLKTIPDVMRYLDRNGITDLTRENFTFNTKVNVGEFFELSHGHNMPPVRLAEHEVLERIAMSKGKRARMQELARKKREKVLKQQALAKQLMEMKLKRKVEQQDLARKAAELKFQKRLEKQRQKELAKRAKQLKAMEKRKQKEQLRMMKQQEKVRRQEQQRVEREMKAQQILESNLLWFHMEREREMKRQQAVMLRDQERERRRQHLLLLKALEARKKQEEKERVREEKLAEKRICKERKQEQRRLELQMAREMKKPTEDMELRDAKPLPEFPRIPGMYLAGEAFADCLMAVEFLNTFGDALGLDKDSLPTMQILQNALLHDNEEDVEELVSLLVHLLKVAIDDPGVPNPKEAVTKLGQKITDVEVTDSTMSEVLRVFIIARNEGKNEMSQNLEERPVEALNPTQKAAILAFLCNELLQSKNLSSEIDKNIETINHLRREKWLIEGRLRKYRTLQAKKFHKASKQETSSTAGDEDSINTTNMSVGSKHGSDDEEEKEEDEEKDEDDSGNESDATNATNATGNVSEEEDEGLTLEECEKKVDKLVKQHGNFRNKVFDASNRLRSLCLGQDRYKRHFWILPCAGGVYVEGLESGEVESEKEAGSASDPEESNKVEDDNKEDNSKEGDNDNCVAKQNCMEDSEDVKMEDVKDVDDDEDCVEEDRSDVASKCEDQDSDRPADQSGVVPPQEKDIDTADCTKDSNLLPHTPQDIKLSDSLPLPDCDSGKDSPSVVISAHALSSSPHATESPNAISHPSPSPSLPHMCSTPVSSPSTVSPSIKTETKSSFMSIDALLKKDNSTNSSNNHFLPPSLFPPSPLVSDHHIKSYADILDQKPWFSILPRMPCDEMSLTRSPHPSTPTGVSSSSSGGSSLPLFPMLSYKNFPSPSQSPIFSSFQVGQLRDSSLDVSLGSNSNISNTSVSVVPFKVPPPPTESNNLNHSSVSLSTDVLKSIQEEPLPIPLAKQRGWWQILDPEQMRTLVKCLHTRGIREKNLLKTLQKHLDYICSCCGKINEQIMKLAVKEKKDKIKPSTSAASPNKKNKTAEKNKPKGKKGKDKEDEEEKGGKEENAEDEKMEVDAVEDEEKEKEVELDAPEPDDPNWWSTQAMYEVEMAVLEEVEGLEDRVLQASLQVKVSNPAQDEMSEAWKIAQKATEDSDIEMVDRKTTNLKKHQKYPMDIAKERLLKLEKNIERRYLKPPFTKNVQLNLANISGNNDSKHQELDQDEEEEEEDLPAGLLAWRSGVDKCNSPAQLALCIQQLLNAIAWEKSIMKVICQICRKDDNEAELLLCDGCDKGYHTYCFKPQMVTIPDGDWYCYECIAKASGAALCIVCGKRTGKLVECDDCPRAFHTDCIDPPLSRVPKKWSCPACMTEKNKKYRCRRKRKDAPPRERKDSETSKSDSGNTEKKKKEVNPAKEKDLSVCSKLLTDLEKHEDGWPFLQPVNVKQFPSYKKYIKHPMDFSSMRNKLRDNVYKTRSEFATDVRLIFNNCETFNEDDSEVGQAGHNMRKYFEKRWKEILADDS